MALIPTLKLWNYDLKRFGVPDAETAQSIRSAQEQLKAFADLGGEVLFGTDVGYMTDVDPMDEYAYMAQAGLSFGGILASLTTAPARRFGMRDRTGRLLPGMDADRVILEADPMKDIRAFASVAAAM